MTFDASESLQGHDRPDTQVPVRLGDVGKRYPFDTDTTTATTTKRFDDDAMAEEAPRRSGRLFVPHRHYLVSF